MCVESSKRVRSLCGEFEDFMIRVKLYQGYTLSSYLFILILNYITKIYRVRYHSVCYF